MERNITVVVAEHDYQKYDDTDMYGEYSYTDVTFNQSVYTIEELLGLPWFRSYLKDNGFYCKDEADTQGLTHLNNFIYQYGACSYKYYTDNLSDLKAYNCDVLRVYQEVIGPERLHGVGKLIKARDQYLRKQEESAKKQKDKYESDKSAKKLKQIEKAKALLTQEGLLS